MLPIKIEDDSGHTANVTAGGQLEVSVTGVTFPDATLIVADAATETTLALVDTDVKAVKTSVDLLGTEVTSAAILAKITASAATAANQTTSNDYLNTIVTNTGNTKTAVDAVTAKLIAAPATEAKQDTIKTAVDAVTSKLSSDPATQTTSAAILAKIIAAPATEAKQDTIKTAIDAITTKTASMSTTIGQYNIVITNINTEYSQALPTGCRGFEFWTRSGELVRFAFTTGKVAGSTNPYFTLRRGATYQSTGVLDLSSKVLYVASATAGDVVELITWS